ncbi:MAG TPA: efflux RND transporter periplasmic adaptor subunit [Phycisphaerae bacterium]|nr:efflux RND transporter periplasmic adaptor subunit [Phycisphaerae bacterium]
MKKTVMVVLVLAVLGGMGWLVYRRLTAVESDKGPDGSTTTPVAVAEVRQGLIRDIQTFTGTLLPASQFVVSPKTAGRLETLAVDIGDEVASGKLIATLDAQEYERLVEVAQAERDVAQANVEEARSTLEMARREYDRSKALQAKGIASPAELDTAETQFKAADARLKVTEAQVNQRNAALHAAQVRLGYTRIAPEWTEGAATWVVGERFADQGDMLRANDPIVSLLDLSTVKAVVYVTERDYPKIAVGQSVLVTTDAFGDRTFEGRVARLSPVVKETSRQARVEVSVPNPGRLLKAGMFVRAQIEFDRRQDAVIVPSDAIVRRNEKAGVFQADVEAGVARFVPVEVGIVEGETTEVRRPALSGLVVVLGQHLLEDGGGIVVPNHESKQPAATEAAPAEPATKQPAAPSTGGQTR